MGINDTGSINEAVNRQIASNRDPANKSPTTGSLAGAEILSNPSTTPQPVNSLINSGNTANSAVPATSAPSTNTHVNPAVPVESLSAPSIPSTGDIQQTTPVSKASPDISLAPDTTPLITGNETEKNIDKTAKGEIVVLTGDKTYNAEDLIAVPMPKIGSDEVLSNSKISDFLSEGKSHINSICTNISNQGASKLIINGDLDFSGKNLGVMIQPGHYKSGQKFDLINTSGKFIHDISESPKFDLYNTNRQDLKYNSGLLPNSIAKVTYSDHGASFEFIRDISVTYSGFADPNFNSEL